MKSIKVLTSLMFSLAMAFIVSGLFALPFTGILIALFAFSFIPMKKGVAFMALQKEIWEKDIIDNLFKNNEFALRAFNADQFVLQGKVVHIPTAGTPTGIKKNLTNFPQTATERADAEITYAIDTYYALPRRIAEIDKYELSYDKRQSVVGEDEKKLIQDAMGGLLYRWAPGSTINAGMAKNIILTTGADTAEDVIDDTATGSRKTFTKDAIKSFAKKIAASDLNGRANALLTAFHYHQFFESLSDAEKTNFNNVANLKEGVIGRYMGVDILMRSSVLRYRGADIASMSVVDDLAEDFEPGVDDRAASLMWVDSAVERAKGDVHVFDNPGQALYYGDVFSALLRLGGRVRRASGVWVVVEDLGA